MKRLFNDDSEDEAPVLTTNKEYEKVYNSFREKELKQKLKDKGLDAELSPTDDSDTSSDDNDGEDPEFDEVFFKTLASLKSKDPKIYRKDTVLFKDVAKATKKDKKKSKIFTVKDLERKVILENDGEFVDDDDGVTAGPSGRAASPSLAEKERALKRELQTVANQDSDDEDAGWGGLFQKRRKTDDEELQEEKQFAKWLAGQEKEIKEDDKVLLKDLKNYWDNPKLSKEDKFLRDYILKGKHKENSHKEVPTLEEVLDDAAPLSEDERDLEIQDEFEKKYNFRYEEPDQDFIKSYPRTIEWSVRATDERRKEKRTELKERKEREREQQRQELEMLKEIKRKEIQDKIDKLKRVTGNETLPINYDFLDEDFDEDAHDRKMQEMFNDEYYQVDEGEEKPALPEDIDDLKVEDYDNYDPAEDNDQIDVEVGDGGPEEGSSTVDRKKEFQAEVMEGSRGRRRKRQSKFVQMLKKEKPVFDPEDEKTYGEYIDEYYKMDYEDMIGDVKCRFKYVETVPNDFGLTTAEILLAKSKELNQWAGIKKAVQIRPPHVEQNEAKVYQMKGKNVNLKKKILKSLFAEEELESDREEEPTAAPVEEKNKVPEQKTPEDVALTSTGSAKKKRNRNRKKGGQNGTVVKTNEKPNVPVKANKSKNAKEPENKKTSKKFHNHKNIKELDKRDATHISENRLRALGINPKKYQNKLIYGNKDK